MCEYHESLLKVKTVNDKEDGIPRRHINKKKKNRVDGTFITSTYDNFFATLKASFGNHLHKDNLKNRLKTLKDHFGVCYDLFHNLSGFSWNPDTKLFTAEVWADLIK
ncbi:hypothetical protein HN51_059558, partial [Arachis hypogaea]